MEICNIAPKFNQVTYKILSFYCIFYLCFSRTMVLCIKRLRFFCCSNIFFLFFYLLFSFFFSFIFIGWRLITSQHCSGFCHTLTWISHGVTCILHPDPPPTSLSLRFLWAFPVHQARALVSCIPSGLVICFTLDNILFSRNICSPETSHPCLLPQSPKVCPVHLCLFFCFAYRVIITIFLNSIFL